MAFITAVGTAKLPFILEQSQVCQFTKSLFSNVRHIEKLLSVFENGQIETRSFVEPLEWYQTTHSFAEKNDLYIQHAVRYGCEAIKDCLEKVNFHPEDIDALFFISTTGLATPSIEARIMNNLSFSKHTKRIPIWGLGCAGGAAGLARAYEYCTAFKNAKVLVVAVEFCSLTFQLDDISKSNLIGTSLFADGVGCVCVVGENVVDNGLRIVRTQSTLMSNSESVMGWDVRDNGLYVIFSKDIPTLIDSWLKPNVENFLDGKKVDHFIAHPGGKKVLDAYIHSFDLSEEQLQESTDVLKKYGNMSSVTILYVLEQMQTKGNIGEMGLMAALGPGFSSELLLLRWE